MSSEAMKEIAKNIDRHWIAVASVIIPICMGTAICVLVNLPLIAQREGRMKKILTLLSIIFTGAAASFLGVFALELIKADPTAELQLLAAGISGAAGQKGIDLLVKRMFSFEIKGDYYDWDGRERRKRRSKNAPPESHEEFWP